MIKWGDKGILRSKIINVLVYLGLFLFLFSPFLKAEVVLAEDLSYPWYDGFFRVKEFKTETGIESIGVSIGNHYTDYKKEKLPDSNYLILDRGGEIFQDYDGYNEYKVTYEDILNNINDDPEADYYSDQMVNDIDLDAAKKDPSLVNIYWGTGPIPNNTGLDGTDPDHCDLVHRIDGNLVGCVMFLIQSAGVENDQAVAYLAIGDDLIGPVLINGTDTPITQNVTKGVIWGGVFDDGSWKTDSEEILGKKKGLVTLLKKNTNNTFSAVSFKTTGESSSGEDCSALAKEPVEGVGASDWAAPLTSTGVTVDSGGGYAYTKIPMGCFLNGSGLPIGNYRLAYMYSEKGDYAGNAKPENALFNIFDVDFSGYTDFSLEAGDEGYGNIRILSTNKYASKSGNTTNVTDPIKGIHIDVSENSVVENTFADIMNRAINIVLAAATKVIDWGGKLIHQMLIWGNDIELDASGATTGKAGIRQVWESTRNMGLSLLTLVLLMVAFANILNLKLDQYGITKIIPKIIIAIVMTYFSFFIAAFLLDLMSALQALLFQEASNGSYFQLSSQINGTIVGQVGQSYDMGDLLSKIPELLFLEILVVCLVIVVLWLLLVLIVRNAMIFILVSLAPIAFLAMILPFTEKYYQQWWAAFWKWAFIGPAIAFMLWLTQEFLGGYGASAFGTFGSDTAGAWTFLIAAAVMIWLTATLPLKMGSEVYGAITKHADKVPGVKSTKKFLEARKASSDQRSAQRALRARNNLSKAPLIGGLLAGVNNQQKIALQSQTLKALAEGAPEESIAFNKALKKSKGLKREALLAHGAKEGLLDAGDEEVRKMVLSQVKKERQENNNAPGSLERALYKGQGDFLVESATHDSDFETYAMAALSGTAVSDYKDKHWNYLSARHPERYHELAGNDSAVDAALKSNKGDKAIRSFAENMIDTGAVMGIVDDNRRRSVYNAAGRGHEFVPTPGPLPGPGGGAVPPTGPGSATQSAPQPSPEIQAARASLDEQRAASQAEIDRRRKQ